MFTPLDAVPMLLDGVFDDVMGSNLEVTLENHVPSIKGSRSGAAPPARPRTPRN